MFHKTLLSAVVISAMTMPIIASAFTAENRTKVTPAAGNTFVVSPSGRFGVPGQWCAASDYAQRVLGADWSQRLYVQGSGSERRSIVFGLDPAGATPSKITVVSRSAKTPGANFSVQRAYAFCIEQRRSRLNDD